MKKQTNKLIYPLIIMGVFLVFAISCEKDDDTSWSEEIWKRNNVETYLDLRQNVPLFCINGTLANDQATFSSITWEDSYNGYFSITTTQSTAWLHIKKNDDNLMVGPVDEVYSQSHDYATYYQSTTWSCDGEVKTCYGVTPPSGYGIVESSGRCWLDRNLGASQVATSSTDAQSYGDLYQWGRGTDGHQIRTSGTTSNLSNSDMPGHGDFIWNVDVPFDWRSPQNDNLWQGVSGINNPCPSGWRLPTEAEWNAELQSWSSNNAAGAFASPLKLPVAGYRKYSNGSLGFVGSYGYYWSSTVDGTYASYLSFYSSTAGMYSFYRAYGRSVRCLKD